MTLREGGSGPDNFAYPAELSKAAVIMLTTAPPGTRVVARYRVEVGFTDALGVLRSCDRQDCIIETRRGPVTVRLADVVAAKQVPPPPERRPGGATSSRSLPVDPTPDRRA